MKSRVRNNEIEQLMHWLFIQLTRSCTSCAILDTHLTSIYRGNDSLHHIGLTFLLNLNFSVEER